MDLDQLPRKLADLDPHCLKRLADLDHSMNKLVDLDPHCLRSWLI